MFEILGITYTSSGVKSIAGIQYAPDTEGFLMADHSAGLTLRKSQAMLLMNTTAK
jgi:hypothetical protein